MSDSENKRREPDAWPIVDENIASSARLWSNSQSSLRSSARDSASAYEETVSTRDNYAVPYVTSFPVTVGSVACGRFLQAG